ncbi:hypothetical protein RB601_007674 [Gaeumannomyces tritici]
MSGLETAAPGPATPRPKKLHGRAFYESIGSPKYIVAPMVDQSEFAWRMLTRSFMPKSEQSNLLAYTPMLHARLFGETQAYRDSHFQATRPGADAEPPTPWLDGNPAIDRPLFVQFCANEPAALLDAARRVAPHCDAVDLNLGCPQGIAKKGRYGAFLQEDQALIHRLIRTLHEELPVPVTAKIRILDTPEATLAYARNVLDAGASILTVHGRRREQKGHLTGVADWAAIRRLRDELPPDTVLFANGNVLQRGDVEACLAATGADGVMSAEGNLSDPSIFAAEPSEGEEAGEMFTRGEYWRGVGGGVGGFRVDAVLRRYLDILHRYVEGEEPPSRRPLFVPGDDEAWLAQPPPDPTAATETTITTITTTTASTTAKNGDQNGEAGEAGEGEEEEEGPARKKRKRNKANNDKKGGGADPEAIGKKDKVPSPNYIAVKGHLFHLLRHFVSRHTDVRDLLARARLGPGYLPYLERVLDMVERRVAGGLLEYERTGGRSFEDEPLPAVKVKQLPKELTVQATETEDEGDEAAAAAAAEVVESSLETVRRCRRPWWVVQPIVRPLPAEAAAKGAITLKKAKPPPKAPVQRNGHKPAAAAAAAEAAPGVAATEAKVAELEKQTDYPTNDLVSG